MSETWTIGELAERATDALRAASGSPVNGRVREVPGERLIRWYTTIGLVDPPLTRRGRIALYGRRHLLQLIAVKRRQADGRTIAEIQAELTGAADPILEAIARIPETPDETAATAATRTPRPRFWAEPPAAPAVAEEPRSPAPPAQPAQPAQPATIVHGVRLAAGVTVLLDGGGRTPSPDDLAEITAASAALLAVLRERGLTSPEGKQS